MAEHGTELSSQSQARWRAGELLLALRRRRAILVLALLLGIFLPLSLSIHQPGMQAWDLAVTRWVQEHRSAPLDAAAVALSTWGSAVPLIVLVLVAAAALWLAAKPLAAGLCLAALLTLPINEVLKLFFGRARPSAESVQVLLPALGLSYPSGHAMSSSTLCGILAVMAWLYLPSRALRLPAVLALATVIVGIGLSRVYLGAHWLSDVVGGWTAGLLLVLGLTSLHQRLARRTADQAGCAARTG